MRAMMLAKLKVAAMVLAVAMAAGTGAGVIIARAGESPPPPPGVASTTVAGPSWSEPEKKPPVVKEEGLKVVEISAPGWWKQSNTKYVVTKDIEASGTALMFGELWNTGVENCVIDLGGHTVTYNAEPKKEAEAWKGNVYGLFLKTSKNVLVKNGRIIQGKAASPGCHGALLGPGCELDGVTVKVTGGGTDCIQAGGSSGSIHGCYAENRSSEQPLPQGLFGPRGIALARAAGWDVYDNTVVGGHVGIEVSANGNDPFESGCRIHHNRVFHTKRVHGLKSPHSLMVYASNGNELFENQVVTIDTRGVNVQMGSVGNTLRNNIVDCRYSTVAEEGNYVENRCYGYWERGVGDAKRPNRVLSNVFIVNNETTGDNSSSSAGITIGFGGGGAREGAVAAAEFAGNRVFCLHRDPACTAVGIDLVQCGQGVKATGNWVLAGTEGVEVSRRSTGVVVEANVLVKPTGAAAWQAVAGDSVGTCKIGENRTAAQPAAGPAPAAPEGLKAIGRPGAVELRWKPSAGADVLGYNVYRDGQKANRFLGGPCFYVDLALDVGAKHSYSVAAVDVAGGEGPKSKAVEAAAE